MAYAPPPASPPPPPLILASASPRRRDLLASLVPEFTVIVPQVAEDDTGIHPPHVPVAHATTKAAAVAIAHPDALTLGADTIIYFHGEKIGKPATIAAARHLLLRLAGHRHEVITGICLLSPARHLRCRFAVTSTVHFRHFGEADVTAYLARVNPLDKAGAYALQEDQGDLVAKVDGSPSNVVGLPLEALAVGLQACGLGRTMTNCAPPPGASS